MLHDLVAIPSTFSYHIQSKGLFFSQSNSQNLPEIMKFIVIFSLLDLNKDISLNYVARNNEILTQVTKSNDIQFLNDVYSIYWTLGVKQW